MSGYYFHAPLLDEEFDEIDRAGLTRIEDFLRHVQSYDVGEYRSQSRWRQSCAARKYAKVEIEERRKAAMQREADAVTRRAAEMEARAVARLEAIEAGTAELLRRNREAAQAAELAVWHENQRRIKQSLEAKAELIKEIESWGAHFGPDYDYNQVQWRPSGDGIEARFSGRTIFIKRDITNLLARI